MSSQNRLVVGVVALVAVLAGFWFLVLAPKRTDIGAVDAQIVQAESRRAAAVAAAAQAEQARGSYQSDYATVARLGKAVPADDDVASLVYQLETVAKANDIDFRAVKLTGAAAPGPAPAAAPPATTEDGDDPAAAAVPVAPVVSQPPPGAVVGTAGLVTVPFTLTFDGDYMKLQRFLKAADGLANGEGERISVRGRLLTVDGFALAASSTGFPQLKATVSATAYLAPADAGAAATPPAGAAAGAPTTTAMTTQNAQGAGR